MNRWSNEQVMTHRAAMVTLLRRDLGLDLASTLALPPELQAHAVGGTYVTSSRGGSASMPKEVIATTAKVVVALAWSAWSEHV